MVGPISLGAIHLEPKCAQSIVIPSIKQKERLPVEIMSSSGQHTLPRYMALPLDLMSRKVILQKPWEVSLALV